MKRKLVVLCLAAVLAVSALLLIQSRSDKQNDLLLANVEALAEDETYEGIFCTEGIPLKCNPIKTSCYWWIVGSNGDIKCFFSGYEGNL